MRQLSAPVHTPHTPAWSVITDFCRDSPFTVRPDLPVDAARESMERLGINCLLVTAADEEDPSETVLGLITAIDIDRRISRKSSGTVCRREVNTPLTVRDVMTAAEDLPVIHFESLQGKSVRDLHDYFQGTGLTHFLVVEDNPHDTPVARGLISRAAVTRRLRAGADACSRPSRT